MQPLSRSKVYRAIGIGGTKIPKDMEGTFPVTIRSDRPYALSLNNELAEWYDGEWQGNATIVKASGTSKHRIFLHCPCGKLVPFGRIAQHKCK